MSSAAKREDIQKRLQDLRNQKQKEKEAFDQLVAENKDLSAAEIAALAREQAEKTAVENSILVDGVRVAIGDSVTVADDPQALARAERGVFPPDPIKRVYLGESGKVVRVWSAFQGKPAVELCFADTCTKIFLAECLELDRASAAPTPAGATTTTATADGAARSLKVPAATPTSPTEQAVVAVPSWASLALPAKGNAAPKPPSASTIKAAPTSLSQEEAATVTANGSTTATRGAAVAVASATATGKTTGATTKPTSISKSRPTRMPDAPGDGSASTPTQTGSTHPPTAGAAAAVTDPCRPRQHEENHSKASVAAAPARALEKPVPAPVEGLGRPTEYLTLDERRPEKDPAGAAEMDDLLRTPRPDFLTTSTRSGGAPRLVSPGSSPLPSSPSPTSLALATAHDGPSAIPTQCPANYQPKFPLYDPESHIPQLTLVDMHEQVPKTPEAARAGTSAQTAVDEPPRRRPSPRVTSSSGVRTPKRGTFSTPIAPSRSVGSHPAGPSSAASVRPSSTMRSRVTRPTSATTPGRPASASRPAVSAARASSRISTRVASPPPTSSSGAAISASLAGARKPIQVRVFENGIYDNDAYDRVYRTITIRPTYKTIASLKSMVGRELLWRDGRKVDVLFDASGAEISDLAAIQEGQSLIASSGDRFVIPFPNSILHAEALKLSQQQ